MTKVCTACNKEKILKLFSICRWKNGEPQRAGTCKDCRNEYSREYREKGARNKPKDFISITNKSTGWGE